MFSYARRSSGFKSRKRRKGERLRPLAFEILPSLGRRSVQVWESTAAIGSVEKRDMDHWFLRPGSIRRSAQKGRLWTIGCSHRYPTSFKSFGSCMRFSFMNRRVEVLIDIRISALRISEVLRSRNLGHFKSRNSERITSVHLREDACCVIIHFRDPGIGL
jgi:hypothetical protein